VARITPIRLLRTTQVNLDSQGGSSNLLEGEPYWITDEGRLAIGTGTGSYTEIGPFRYPPRATKTASATTDFVLDGTAYMCQLDTDITTWTASLPSGGNAANFEYSCRIDFTPPASGTYTVTIPSAWEQAGPLDAISLSDADVGILVVLSTKADGTIIYTAQELS